MHHSKYSPSPNPGHSGKLRDLISLDVDPPGDGKSANIPDLSRRDRGLSGEFPIRWSAVPFSCHMLHLFTWKKPLGDHLSVIRWFYQCILSRWNKSTKSENQTMLRCIKAKIEKPFSIAVFVDVSLQYVCKRNFLQTILLWPFSVFIFSVPSTVIPIVTVYVPGHKYILGPSQSSF